MATLSYSVSAGMTKGGQQYTVTNGTDEMAILPPKSITDAKTDPSNLFWADEADLEEKEWTHVTRQKPSKQQKFTVTLSKRVPRRPKNLNL